MLPKQYRLKRSKDFARVRRTGRPAHTSILALYVRPTKTGDIRVGFSVSKKVGKATVRNRVRRRMREAVRLHIGSVARGQDLVFIARPAAADATFAAIQEATTYVLRKTRAMRTADKDAG